MNTNLKDPRKVFSRILKAIGRENPKVLAVSCDSASGSGMAEFIKEFPKRYVEIGISEQTAIGVCAGLAEGGYIPVVSAIAPFISMRCYEQIRNDVGYANMNVKIIGSSSGLSHSTLGSSHQAVEDISLMRTIPNMVIINPGDAYEVEMALRQAVAYQGPVYIRMPRHGMVDFINSGARSFAIGTATQLLADAEATFFATGTMVGEALKAAILLETWKIKADVIDFPTVKPLDTQMLDAVCQRGGRIFTVEEHSVVGGFGGAVAEYVAGCANGIPVNIFGIEAGSINNGPYRELLAAYGLTGKELAKRVRAILTNQQ
ncbi:MAG: transketolase C-terminal domain-containing protein [Bacillota bacterium]|jgi:transketolase